MNIYDPASDELDWINVDDPVMGGKSNSDTHVRRPEPALIFAGEVSLENNGGFCSTRTEGREWQLPSEVSAFELRVRGDGKRYLFTVRTDDHSAGSYRCAFETRPGVIETHSLAVKDFEMHRRGTHLPDAPPLDPTTIRSIGILIGGGQEGAFELELFAVKIGR